MKKKTPPGTYQVHVTTESGHSGSKTYGDHMFVIESAKDADDAYKQATSKLTAAQAVVKFTIVFIGSGLAMVGWQLDPFAAIAGMLALVFIGPRFLRKLLG